MILSSNHAWFKFDNKPLGGANVAQDSNGVFDDIILNNAGTYDADQWFTPSTFGGGSGASKTPSIAERELIRLDTLSGALFVHYWIDIQAQLLTNHVVFSYGSKAIKDNFVCLLANTQRPITRVTNTANSSLSLSTGQYAITHIIDIANNTTITAVNGLPKSAGNLHGIPTALPQVNKFGFLLNQNNGTGVDEYGEGAAGNLRISDLMIIRIETDKSFLFPALMVDKFKAGRFNIPASWGGL